MKRLALFALVLTACSQVPNDSLGTGGAEVSAADNRRYEELVLDGRGAFLEETRTVKGVETSHERYKLALQIRSDDYVVLWEAARTAVWLGNYGPKDKQDSYVRDGIRYANTAVKLKPEGEEGLFYDGVLAGKLAELDINYGPSGLEIIQQRMKQLIDLKSTYVYGGPDRVLAIVLMRAPGSPIGPGDWDLAEKHMKKALEIDPNWPENQLYMAELEFGLAKERDDPSLAESARARLQKHFLSEEAKAPMGSGYEFIYWQTDASKLIEDNK
jgi:tetratricopeptide (TPR) repeat protein